MCIKKPILRWAFLIVCRSAFVMWYEVGGVEGAFLGTFGKFGGGGEEDVAGAVQSRFARVLQYADDEADGERTAIVMAAPLMLIVAPRGMDRE